MKFNLRMNHLLLIVVVLALFIFREDRLCISKQEN